MTISIQQIKYALDVNQTEIFDSNEKSFLLEDYINDNDKSKIEKVLKKSQKKIF